MDMKMERIWTERRSIYINLKLKTLDKFLIKTQYRVQVERNNLQMQEHSERNKTTRLFKLQQHEGCVIHLLVDASGDVNSDPLAVAERDGVDGALDGLEVGAPVPADEDGPRHGARGVAAAPRQNGGHGSQHGERSGQRHCSGRERWPY